MLVHLKDTAYKITLQSPNAWRIIVKMSLCIHIHPRQYHVQYIVLPGFLKCIFHIIIPLEVLSDPDTSGSFRSLSCTDAIWISDRSVYCRGCS